MQKLELVKNGGFEELDGKGQPAGWSATLLKKARGDFRMDETVFHAGKRSAMIEGATENAGHCLWRTSRMPLNGAGETEAELSLWIKAEDSPWVMVRVVVRDGNGKYSQYLTPFSIELGGFFDWRKFSKTLTLAPGGHDVQILLVQPRAGRVWFDDVSLVLNKAEESKPLNAPKPVPAASPAPAANAELSEVLDFVKNPTMVGPVGPDNLPLGWSVYNPPQEETIGRVRWVPNDPRQGAQALSVEWIDGGHFIAAQPALTKVLSGTRHLAFQAYVKTADGGQGYLMAECLDGAGRVLREIRSNVIKNAPDYVTCRARFVTHPNTSDVRLYCVNGGAGKVWFHWVTLQTDLKAATENAALPFVVSAEPAEGNRFWNNGEAVLHSFEDSPVSVSFAFWGDKAALKDPKLIVQVPDELTLAEAFNSEPRPPVSHALAEFTSRPITRNGKPYVEYTFPGPAALQRLLPRPYLHNHMCACFVPVPAARNRRFTVTYHAENGGKSGPERFFEMRILPPLERTPNPKRFVSHCWTVDDINFYDTALVERAARRFEEAALAGRERFASGREEIHAVDQLLKRRGWKLFYETGLAGYGFRGMGLPAMDGEGKPSVNSHHFCPTRALADPKLAETRLIPTVRAALEKNRVENGEMVMLDYEPGSIANRYCFCEACRTALATRFGIPVDKVATRRDILANYPREWGRFWAGQCDALIQRHVETFRQVNPTLEHALYCYPIWFNDPEATEQRLFNSPLDTRLNQRHVDLLALSFYYTTGKTALDLMDVNARTLRKPAYLMSMMGTLTPYWAA